MLRQGSTGAKYIALFAVGLAGLGVACTHVDSQPEAAAEGTTAAPEEMAAEPDAEAEAEAETALPPPDQPEVAPALQASGGSLCESVPLTTQQRWADACWVDAAGSVCGVDASQLPGGDHRGPANCVPQDAPGKASAYCGMYFDQIDALVRDAQGQIVRDSAGTAQRDPVRVDGALTLPTEGGLTFLFEGCCLPNGECGASLRQPRPLGPDESLTLMAFNGAPFDFHLGCVSAQSLLGRLLGTDSEAPTYTDLAQLPYCDYSADEPGAPQAGRIAHLPAFLCGCGEGRRDDGKRALSCLHGLAEGVCGEDTPAPQDLTNISETLCGCGATTRGDGSCLPYTASDLCGALPFTDDAFLGFPRELCGCGEGVPARDAPCVSNVAESVCGDGSMSDAP